MPDSFHKSPSEKGYKGKGKKRIMRTFKLNEISAVDFGAQQPALATLIKRRPEEEGDDELVEKAVMLTSSVDNHQHGVHLSRWTLEEGGGHTTHDGGTTDSSHSHSFVINQDGTIVVGEVNGHTHDVDVTAFLQRMRLQTVVEEPVIVARKVKIEKQKEFVAGDYAYVPDPNEPGTWRMRLVGTSKGNPDRRLVGSAVASLERGDIPKSAKSTVIRRVRAAWVKCHPSSPSTDMPSVLKRLAL